MNYDLSSLQGDGCSTFHGLFTRCVLCTCLKHRSTYARTELARAKTEVQELFGICIAGLVYLSCTYSCLGDR